MVSQKSTPDVGKKRTVAEMEGESPTKSDKKTKSPGKKPDATEETKEEVNTSFADPKELTPLTSLKYHPVKDAPY